MRVNFSLNNIDDIEASITLTADVREWKALAKQISGEKWPSCDLLSKINDVIWKANSSFTAVD